MGYRSFICALCIWGLGGFLYALEEEPQKLVHPARKVHWKGLSEQDPQQALERDTALSHGLKLFTAVQEESHNKEGNCLEQCLPAGASYIIDRRRIEQMGAVDLLDIMALLPGIELSLNSFGERSPSIRGVRGDERLLLLLEGIPVNDPYSGNALWNLSADLIESVAFYDGPRTQHFGAGALQAAVDVRLRESNHEEALLRLQTQTVPQLGFAVGKEGEWGKAYGGANLMRNSFSAFSKGSLSHSLYEGMQFSALGITRVFNWDKEGSSPFRLFAAGLLQALFPLGDLHQIRMRFISAFHHNKQGIQNLIFEQGYKSLFFQGEVEDSWHLPMGNYLNFGLTTQSYGILRDSFRAHLEGKDLAQEQVLAPNVPCLAQGSLFGVCRFDFSLWVKDEWTIDEYWRFHLGMRLVNAFTPGAAFYTRLFPATALYLSPDPKWQLRLSYQESLRYPTLEELSDEKGRLFAEILPGHFVGNPKLQPEIAKQLRFDVSHARHFAGMQMLLGIGAFYERIRHVIDRINQQGDINVYQNQGGYDLIGLMGHAKVEFYGNEAIFNLTWQRGYWREVDAEGMPKCRAFFFDPVGEKPRCSFLTRAPQLLANLSFNFDIGRAGNLFVTSHFASERRNNVRTNLERNRPFRLPAYALLHVAYQTRPFLRYLSVSVAAHNIFNIEVEDDVLLPNNSLSIQKRKGTTFLLALHFTY